MRISLTSDVTKQVLELVDHPSCLLQSHLLLLVIAVWFCLHLWLVGSSETQSSHPEDHDLRFDMFVTWWFAVTVDVGVMGSTQKVERERARREVGQEGFFNFPRPPECARLQSVFVSILLAQSKYQAGPSVSPPSKGQNGCQGATLVAATVRADCCWTER